MNYFIYFTSLLEVVASVLAVVCKRMQQLPTIFGPAVHRGKDTTHKTLETVCHARAYVAPTILEELQLCKWIQHCCATLQRSRNKRNVGSYWLNSLRCSRPTHPSKLLKRSMQKV